MQTETTKPSSLFSSIRIKLLNSTDQAKALASCLVGGAIMVTGIRVVQGKYGLFISMPQRRNQVTGDYSDVAFPISKEMREEMSRLILDEFERAANSLVPQSENGPEAAAA
jgi:stage V sporulation protein G